MRSMSFRAGSDPAYAEAILGLVEQEGVDVVLPQSSFDLQALSEVREQFPGAGARVVAEHDPPLERQG